MCQARVEQYLTKNKGSWHKAKNIAKELGITDNSVALSLRKLLARSVVERRETKYNQKWYEWRIT